MVRSKRKTQDCVVLTRVLLCFYCILGNNFFKIEIINKVFSRERNKIKVDISARGLSLSFIKKENSKSKL